MTLTWKGQGHDLDLSGSRDVIGHVAIRLSVGHFLSVVLWNQDFYIWRFPRYSVPNLEC